MEELRDSLKIDEMETEVIEEPKDGVVKVVFSGAISFGDVSYDEETVVELRLEGEEWALWRDYEKSHLRGE